MANPNPSSLTRFQPGNPGGPGRPPGSRTLTSVLRDALEKTRLLGEDLPEGMTAIEALAEAIIVQAGKGNAAYMREIFDRTEGKVPDEVRQESRQTIHVQFDDVPPPDHDPAAAPAPGPTTNHVGDEEI